MKYNEVYFLIVWKNIMKYIILYFNLIKIVLNEVFVFSFKIGMFLKVFLYGEIFFVFVGYI